MGFSGGGSKSGLILSYKSRNEESCRNSFFSISANRFSKTWVWSKFSRIFMNARTTKTLICTAWGLLRMVAALRTAAKGRDNGAVFGKGPWKLPHTPASAV
jgi:hypothetical protein